MQYITKLYITCLFLICTFAVQARISGSVRDSIGDPVIGAVVSLLKTADSTIVDAISTDKDGLFNLDPVEKNKSFIIMVNSLGFRPFKSIIYDEDNISIVLRQSDAETLGELIVTTDKPTVKREFDKFVISPNSYTRLVTNSYDLLGLMPMINRGNDNYSVLGGGRATIYLNGRKPIMSQEQISSYLKSIPPQNIKEIVIIQDSGVSQRGSIINVILDRPDEGFLGFASIATYVREDFSPTGSVMAYYSKNRVAFSAHVHGGAGPLTTQTEDFVYFKDSDITQKQTYKNKNESNAVNTDLLVQYSINPNSYAGVFARIRNNFDTSSNTTENTTINPDGIQHSFYTGSKTFDRHHYMPTTAVATYHYDLDRKGSYFEAVADLDYGQSKTQQNWWGTNIGKSAQYLGYKDISTGLRVDMIKYLGPCRLDAGYSFLNSGLESYTIDAPDVVSDDYHYREFLHKSYVNFSHSPLTWMQYQLGVRLEHIRQHIEQRVENDFVKNSHFDIIPDISASFFLPKAAQQIKINYKIDLNRPRYHQMNPRKRWRNESYFSQGNPYLEPSKCHIASLYYMWNYCLYGQILINYMDDYITRVIKPVTQRITANTYNNFGKFFLTNITIGYTKVFFNRWQIHAYTSAQYRNIDGGDLAPESKSVSWQWGLHMNNNVVISQRHKVRASLGLAVSSPLRSLYNYYRWNNESSISISKQFGCDWNLSLSVSNFIPRNRMTIQDSYELYYSSRNLTRQTSFYLSAQYSFGNNSVRKARTNQSATVDSRQ